MIGNWLETLNDKQLGRLLTRQCVNGQHQAYNQGAPACLVENAYDIPNYAQALSWPGIDPPSPSYRAWGTEHAWNVPRQYDVLVWRFGLDRINAAIRNRCLRILARRNVPAPSMEVAAC